MRQNLLPNLIYRWVRSTLIVSFLLVSVQVRAAVQLTARQTDIFQRLHRQAPRLPAEVLREALHAYFQAKTEGHVKRGILTVIDFAFASTDRRLWTFDLGTQRLLFHTYVAHGRNSGDRYATHFSNTIDSKESSLGLFVTGKPYYGHLGYALRLIGLERGINDHAYKRDIVVHGAPYVGDAFVRQYGHLGRSWGCPAVDEKIIAPFIDTIKGGSAIFAYYPSTDFLSHSVYL